MTTSLAALPRGALVEAEAFVDVDVARCAGVEVYKCRFERCRFVEAVLDKVVFEDVEFVDCDLTRVRFGHSSLRGVRFVRCKLLGVDFSRAADHPDVAFDGCSLSYAVFDGVALKGVRFLECQLGEASFVGSDLRDADFARSDLTRAVLRDAKLGGADFSTSTALLLDPARNDSNDALISVETAIHLAQAAGLRVAGHDDERRGKRPKRR
jgi:fluoroquinolone resistance protein